MGDAVEGDRERGHEGWDPDPLRPRHPIGVVSQRTGLSSHALRAWERRYDVVEPARSEGGHRLYTDADVEKLRLLHRLTLHGRQIGQIADLPTDELRSLLREDRREEATAPAAEPAAEVGDEEVEELLRRAFAAVERMDTEQLDGLLRQAVLTLSTVSFLEDLLVPLLGRIGQAWAEEELRPAHEHMASAVTARVAGWLMDAFTPAGEAPCLVVATPAGNRHELGALSAAVTAASVGWRVRYLGADLPPEDIALTARRSGARAVALSVVYPSGEPSVGQELRRLRRELPDDVPLLVGGEATESYEDALGEIGAVRLNGFRSLRAVLLGLQRDQVH